MSNHAWKSVVTSCIKAFALNELNMENSCKSRTSQLSPYESLKPQSYLESLRPADARLFFAMRSGTLDIKTMRKYNYDEGDLQCRLCGTEEETLDHIVNVCCGISRNCHVKDILSGQKEEIVEVVSRVKEFKRLADEKTMDCLEMESKME